VESDIGRDLPQFSTTERGAVFHLEEGGRKTTEISFFPDGYYVQQVTEKEEYYIISSTLKI
jgi:hypothetical protein